MPTGVISISRLVPDADDICVSEGEVVLITRSPRLDENEEFFGSLCPADSKRVVIPFSDVSMKHAIITCGREGIKIRDLGSTNGTYLDGEKLVPGQEYILRPHQELKIAQYEVSLFIDGAPASDTPDSEVSEPKSERKGQDTDEWTASWR